MNECYTFLVATAKHASTPISLSKHWRDGLLIECKIDWFEQFQIEFGSQLANLCITCNECTDRWLDIVAVTRWSGKAIIESDGAKRIQHASPSDTKPFTPQFTHVFLNEVWLERQLQCSSANHAVVNPNPSPPMPQAIIRPYGMKQHLKGFNLLWLSSESGGADNQALMSREQFRPA